MSVQLIQVLTLPGFIFYSEDLINRNAKHHCTHLIHVKPNTYLTRMLSTASQHMADGQRANTHHRLLSQ